MNVSKMIENDTISGAFGPKLKELEITGPNLRYLTLDAFEGRVARSSEFCHQILYKFHWIW